MAKKPKKPKMLRKGSAARKASEARLKDPTNRAERQAQANRARMRGTTATGMPKAPKGRRGNTANPKIAPNRLRDVRRRSERTRLSIEGAARGLKYGQSVGGTKYSH